MPSSPGSEDTNGARSPQGAGPMVPLLRIDEGLSDPVALTTWHEALSDALAADLPHDLLGLWLYPSNGGVVLRAQRSGGGRSPGSAPLSPTGPRAAPELAGIVRDAGYGSTACLPIRFGKRDVGLLLVADLRGERFGEVELLLLRSVAQRLAPALGRIARQWDSGHGSATYQLERVAALLEAIAQAGSHAGTPQLFIASLSRALEPLLPHDRIELLLSDPTGARSYRVGEHAAGPLWSDPSLILAASDLALEDLFGSHDRIVMIDACREGRWPRGYFTVSEQAGAELRAVVGARVSGPRGLRAYLLVGSIGQDLYDEHDAALLARVSGLIAPQVGLFVANATPEPAPAPQSEPDAVSGVLLEVSQLLALNGDLSGSYPAHCGDRRAVSAFRSDALRDSDEPGRPRGAAGSRRAAPAPGPAADSGRRERPRPGAPGGAAVRLRPGRRSRPPDRAAPGVRPGSRRPGVHCCSPRGASGG